MKNQWVLEWSQKQNAFHIQPLSASLARSQEMFLENKTHQYITLMVGEKNICEKMADDHRHRLDERSKSCKIFKTLEHA